MPDIMKWTFLMISAEPGQQKVLRSSRADLLLRHEVRGISPARAALQHHPVGRKHQVSRLREENLHGAAEAAAGGDSGQNQGPT